MAGGREVDRLPPGFYLKALEALKRPLFLWFEFWVPLEFTVAELVRQGVGEVPTGFFLGAVVFSGAGRLSASFWSVLARSGLPFPCLCILLAVGVWPELQREEVLR